MLDSGERRYLGRRQNKMGPAMEVFGVLQGSMRAPSMGKLQTGDDKGVRMQKERGESTL